MSVYYLERKNQLESHLRTMEFGNRDPYAHFSWKADPQEIDAG
jgi:hypothetical protein